MAWNEPGGNGRDPWNQGRRSGGNAPDLDDMLAKLRSRFGGRGTGGGLPTGSLGLIVALIALLWGAFGFYVVDEQERAVVLRFGAFERTEQPGLRWHMPWPVEAVEKVNVTQVRQITERSDMLTGDENIIDVALKVQYRISSAENYLFSLEDPDATLRQMTKSAVREVVGRSKMDFILSGAGRQDVAERTSGIVQERLESYASGLQVTELNLQDIQAPDPVQGAFQDVIKAREDQVRLKNEAEAYANDRLPKARGQAARETAEAIAYRDRLVAAAQGESSRFTQLLTEYRKAPQVTRDRLYFETMSDVFAGATKVIVDVDQNGPMIYLPLEQLRQLGGPTTDSGAAPPAASARSQNSPDSNFRSRERGGRR